MPGIPANSVSSVARASVSGEIVHRGDRSVRVVAIPIGADFDRIQGILADENLQTTARRLAAELRLKARAAWSAWSRPSDYNWQPGTRAAIKLAGGAADRAAWFTLHQIGVPSRADVLAAGNRR
jgi:hypothetical protein